MARPDLLVLDEPTAGIDPLVQAEVLDLVIEARRDGSSVFLSSHVLSDVQRVADEVVVIRAGKVVASGDVDALRQTARQEFTAWFTGPAPLDELEAAGVREVDVRGSEVRGVIEGAPNALLAVLARHPVEHLILSEPDLEQAFLRFYEDGSA
jgi:ABC-2 type transport system ATP-binding protein